MSKLTVITHFYIIILTGYNQTTAQPWAVQVSSTSTTGDTNTYIYLKTNLRVGESHPL